jgi:hypothetical protein
MLSGLPFDKLAEEATAPDYLKAYVIGKRAFEAVTISALANDWFWSEP